MHLAMMPSAQRHGELVAGLAAERAMLREAKMMGICRPAPANQARLFGHEPDVLLVTKAPRLGVGQPALVDAIGNGRPGRPNWSPLERRGRWRGADMTVDNGWSLTSAAPSSVASLAWKRIFDLPRVGCGQTILSAKDPMSPDGGVVR